MRESVLLPVLLSLFISGCDKKPPLTFAKNPNGAVLQSGIAGNPTFIADPGVVRDMSGYHLFITNQFCDLNANGVWDDDEHLFRPDETLFCVADRGVGAIMYAHSDDAGLTWTVRPVPVVAPGPSGWDNYNVETAFPFVHNDTLYVFYSAYGVREGSLFKSRYQIGYASLALGGRTIKQALVDDAEVLGKPHGGAAPFYPGNVTTADYDNNTQEPSVVVTPSGFELFFTGLRLSDPASDLSPGNGNQITGLALVRQKYDSEWNKIGDLEISSSFPEDVDPNSEAAAITPVNISEVRFYGGEYHIFYTTLEMGSEFHKGERIAHAVSKDGLSWSDAAVILEHGNHESDFDGWGIMAPTVVLDGDQAVLFYSAWGDTSSSPCVMQGDGARWGQQVEGGSKCVHGSLGRATAVLQSPDY